MESIESAIIIPSITNYHSGGPPIFNRNAESQRAFVLQNEAMALARLQLIDLIRACRGEEIKVRMPGTRYNEQPPR